MRKKEALSDAREMFRSVPQTILMGEDSFDHSLNHSSIPS